MIDLRAASAWQASRSFLARLPRQPAAIAVGLLSLVSAFVLVVAPATAAAPVSSNDHVVLVSDPPPRCPGEKPGMCPD